MITLPIGCFATGAAPPLPWGTLAILFVLALIVQAAAIAVAAIGIYRWHSRTERWALNAREDNVAVRENQVGQERLELTRQAEDLYLRELELGRQAHDVGTQAKVLIHEMHIEDDATVLMDRTEEGL
jgi:hypothetical protein